MSEKAKEDNAKQPLHHDLDSISKHLCTQRRDEAPKGMIVQGVVQQSTLCAKTGRSPSRNTAQGNTLGNSEPSNLRSERAIGMIMRCVLAISFCSFRAQNSNTNPTQGNTLGYNPIGASPRSCSTIDCLHKLEQQFVYYVSSCSTIDLEYFIYFLLIEFLA